MDNNSKTSQILLLSSALFIIFLVHAGYYFPFLADDALISLRYAERLLQGKGLTWTDGYAVEGYSNLLWILLNAALGKAGVDLILSARLLGVLFILGTIFLIIYNEYKYNYLQRNLFPAAAGLGFFVLAAPVAAWSIAGLEQPLLLFLLCLSMFFMLKIIKNGNENKIDLLLVSLPLGLLTLTRPDALLFAGAFALSLIIIKVLNKKPFWADAILLFSLPVIFTAAQTVFRVVYYGELVPNTALVKISPSIKHLLSGGYYILMGNLSLLPFSAAVLYFLWILLKAPETRDKAIFFSVMLFVYMSYLIFIGGDIFPAFRHLLPIILVFTFIITSGLQLLRTHWISRVKIWHLIPLFIIYIIVQQMNNTNRYAITENWVWEGKELSSQLKAAFEKDQPLIAVTAAGCIPYWTKFPSMDMLGLNDYYIPRHPPKDFGNRRIGHELGDGRYIYSRNPDIIIFHVGDKRTLYRSGEDLDKMKEFHSDYIPVTLLIPDAGLQPVLYFNKYGTKTGIKKLKNKMIIPGYLFGSTKEGIYLDKDSKLKSYLNHGDSLRISIKYSINSDWQAYVKTSVPEKIKVVIIPRDKSTDIYLISEGNKKIGIEEVTLKQS